MRYTITCDEPNDIIIGMKAIKTCIEHGTGQCICTYTNGQVWFARKTKAGYSAKLSEDTPND